MNLDSCKQALMLRFGEIALKGLNRHKFEERLIHNLALKLKQYGSFQVTLSQSRIWIEPDLFTKNYSVAEIKVLLKQAEKVACSTFGIVSVSPVYSFTGEYADLLPVADELVQQHLNQGERTFKVVCKRGEKSFPMTSMEVMEQLGGDLLQKHPELKVDLHTPDFVVYVEIRKQFIVYSQIKQAVRGLPTSSSSRGLCLLSGGIDSPVAAYMMASRGMELEAIYFHTFPYTSDLAKQKVIDIAKIVSQYSGRVILHVVDFTEINLELNEKCEKDMITIVMRRMMMRIAEALAKKRDCKALITGESLGQVASQTTEAINATDEVAHMPIFRPLIGLDKEDTIKIARKIGTFETSIQPYDDCCTIFVAKHPKTRPNQAVSQTCDSNLDTEKLTELALTRIDSYDIRYDRIKEFKLDYSQIEDK